MIIINKFFKKNIEMAKKHEKISVIKKGDKLI